MITDKTFVLFYHMAFVFLGQVGKLRDQSLLRLNTVLKVGYS
ncbi:hypothetical protein VCR15J2_60034 [Vibrio coralliirubri]|nr:hypothetical protein VCR15J2_60034 [Vibrio coralliirubri]